ncbi:MAG: ribonuclease HI family protein [Patescibacteria group bacterium]
MPDFIIHTDGGSRGNPGAAAIGVVIESSDKTLKKEYGELIGVATNNDAEYQAVIFALKKLKSLIGKEKAAHASVLVQMDSELIERQLNGHFKINDERMGKYFIQIWNLKMDYGLMTFEHVYREANTAADRMVNAALDKETDRLL